MNVIKFFNVIILSLVITTHVSAQDLCGKLRQYQKVYITVPFNMDEYDRYSASCVGNYFRNLGVSVSRIECQYQAKMEEYSSTTAMGLQSLVNLPRINDVSGYLLVAINYGTVFQMFGSNQCAVYITIFDSKSDWKMTRNIYPMPHKFKKAEKKLKETFCESLY